MVIILVTTPLLLTDCKDTKTEPKAKGGYYTCSMHPQVIKQEPGNCPICGMKLTYQEVLEEEAHHEHDNTKKTSGNKLSGSMGDMTIPDSSEKKTNVPDKKNFNFRLSSTVLLNANIATEPVIKEVFSKKTKYSAHLDYNEGADKLVIVSTKYDGWLEKVFVTTEGQYLNKGQNLFGIYSPKILAAKEEYVTTYNSLKNMYFSQGKNNAALKSDLTVQAARRQLNYLDISESQIRQLETSGKSSRLTYYSSPISGVVVKKDILQGSFIKSGQELIRIADLSKLWGYIHVFEKDLPYIKKGVKVNLKTTAYPDKDFPGRIDLISPFLDPSTRDIKVRIVISNPKRLLKPGMFAEVNIESKLDDESLVIPDTAAIYSGEKSYAFVSLGKGKFEVRPITVLLTSDGKAAVTGLNENELVVTSGQFLLDSEASLKEALSKGAKVGHNH